MGNKRYLGLELKRSLISGLPNDVARHCLAKVPRIYHRSMRSVSRTWKKTLESEDFFAVRRKSGIADAWLVVILMENGHNSYCIYNLASKSLLLKAPLPDPPLPTGLEIGDVGGGGFATFKTAAVGALLVVLESRTSSRRSSVENHTRIFDSIKNKWRAGSPPTVARSQFAMATVNGTVYVAGGCDHDGDFVPATESYDVATDTWTQRSTMPYNNLDRVDCKVVFQGKLYVRVFSSTRCEVLVYDPGSDSWHRDSSGMSAMDHGELVATSSGIYSLTASDCLYKFVDGEWVLAGSIQRKPSSSSSSPAFNVHSQRAFGLRDEIFVLGAGDLSCVIGEDLVCHGLFLGSSWFRAGSVVMG
ncbi:F-box/kelch-repeat protein At1g67480 [Selaginella moellendorffii]|uniref:F-box/kelch-repeat protein At1g67480 n=1 Tax=Selaginella moellendorffii TaxID=88036 RepID=UPI000D1C784A|nr:F-box/kelch-repeat protein At1g67480 [Selaginella moellendorffii]|eukprot:XP_024521162.1 F-box/kelch-repeat protein At1g67480 [Selaginella moellendorffii]